MKALVIYDSNYRNTQKVAEAIAAEFESEAINISSISLSELSQYDLLIVGTPIIGWMPTVKMQEFLSGLKSDQLKGVKATSFDTRVKLFVHGDAMGKVANSLKSAGADICVNPMPFYVAGSKETPYLIDGEIEKAKSWAVSIKSGL